MRTLSAPAREAVYAQEADEVMLVFLDITVPAGVIRVVNNWESVTRLTNEYLPYRFEIGLPNELDEGIPSIPLRIDNIDQSIIEHILSVSEPISIQMNVALASSPDTTEAGPFYFKLKTSEWTPTDIIAQLSFDDVMLEVYPGYRFTPGNFPAAF